MLKNKDNSNKGISVLPRASSLPVFASFIQNTERTETILLLSKIILPDL